MEEYCPACGTQVETDETEVGAIVRISCKACALLLKEFPAGASRDAPPLAPPQQPLAKMKLTRREVTVMPSQPAPAPPAPKAREASNLLDELLDPGTEKPAPHYDLVVLAEDTALLREVLGDALKEGGIAREVITAGDGDQFLERVGALFKAGRHPDLVVLDLEMPNLSGFFAALAFRAFERGFELEAIPVVFFTARAIDDKLKAAIARCMPARYLNKGADSSSTLRVAHRLVQVLSTLKGGAAG